MTLLSESGFLQTMQRYWPLNMSVIVICCALFRLYSSLWEFAGPKELFRLCLASALGVAISYVGMRVMKLPIPRSFVVLNTMFVVALLSMYRMAYRYIRSFLRRKGRTGTRRRTMVIGAGRAGAQAIREFQESEHSQNDVVCIIDDSEVKWKTYLRGVPVVGGRDMILRAVEKYNIEEIILAIPSLSPTEQHKLLEICQKTKCHLRILPGLYQPANGEVSIQKIRNVEIKDLLGRDPVRVDLAGIGAQVNGRVVMVTGGGGSIGSELCRQLAAFSPARLIIFDIYENNAYAIQQELRKKYPDLNLTVLIGSVRDRKRLDHVFSTYRPSLVYHAAAHKHVPLMEDSPCEAVKNNVFGTLNTAEMADKYGVERFLLISTDKAVNPTNIMGTTKRVCEMVIQMVGRHSQTEFVAVRFGNVLGSNGSVVPLFKKQIAEGGPVTVTDPNVIRFFMTIPEAVSLVLQAGIYAKGGEIFILDMGDPVKIDDLARNMIRLSGFEPDVDIPVVYTGLRPGEKLYEEILLKGEGNRKTENDMIFIGRDEPFDDDALLENLRQLYEKCQDNNVSEVRTLLHKVVPQFHEPAHDLAAKKEQELAAV